MPGTDPFLTYAEDASGKVDMAKNIERGVNDRSVFDQEYYKIYAVHDDGRRQQLAAVPLNLGAPFNQ